VDGDRILAMLALDFKKRGVLAKNTMVATTMSNLGLHEAMHRAAIRVDITDVGDRLVIERMNATGANVGGEKSGHVILMDYATTGDGIITALQVLRLMKQKMVTLSELAKCMIEYPQKLVSLKVTSKKPLDSLPTLMRVMAACKKDLGSQGRMIVRYSGTEDKIRLLVEAKQSKQVDAWINKLSLAVKKDLGA
jgi:phosphoglucosamine mutase